MTSKPGMEINLKTKRTGELQASTSRTLGLPHRFTAKTHQNVQLWGLSSWRSLLKQSGREQEGGVGEVNGTEIQSVRRVQIGSRTLHPCLQGVFPAQLDVPGPCWWTPHSVSGPTSHGCQGMGTPSLGRTADTEQGAQSSGVANSFLSWLCLPSMVRKYVLTNDSQ